MPPPVPVATYRVQLNKDFGFDAAATLVPYLSRLGISHLYASPFLAARPGSTHGYDIVDHNSLNPELGGDEAFERLSAALREADIGLILDFVPNHMGVGFSDNAWWLDVLEWGQKSPHAASFDIDWSGLPHRKQPGVLLPILGKPYGDALADGEIELKYDAETGSFSAWYFEHKLPINPQRYPELLRSLIDAANARDQPAGQQIIGLVQPYRTPNAPAHREASDFKRSLSQIDGGAALINEGLSAYDARTETGRFALHRLLERQNFHLAYWRVAFSAINYRRFFDINDLAGLCAEHPATFRAMHGLVARLIGENKLHGLRLDHIDGLRDPAQYTRRLQDLVRRIRPMPRGESFYVLIEKILAENEPDPKLTGVAGTTGYERLNIISHVLLDDRNLQHLEQTWRAFTGDHASFDAMLIEAKTTVLETMLASEFTVLTRHLSRIAAGHFSTRDYTLDRLRAALQAYVLHFPVYRTYIDMTGASEQDQALIVSVIGRARRDWRGPDPDIFDFLKDAITTDLAANPSYSAPRVRNFAMKLQQFTGPLMAKSLEDTTFYRYHRLLALNEVGGEPAKPDTSLDTFHRRQMQLRVASPDGLTATATHDTKRGEDARMRILAIAEIADDWRSAVNRWSEINGKFVQTNADGRTPSAAHEYMLYQALIGAWPLTGLDGGFVDRIKAFAIKAAREGKQQTSWTNPNAAYECALTDFADDILDQKKSQAFITEFDIFAKRTARLGALNSLSQLALKILLPGVPDFFQGTELWDTSLVDPDNRRPVDYPNRLALSAKTSAWPALVESWHDGRIKFALMQRLLKIRNDDAALFRHGDYEPVSVSGENRDAIIGFKRNYAQNQILVLAGRRFSTVTNGGKTWARNWSGEIPGSKGTAYDDLLRGEIVDQERSLVFLFRDFPVAVLKRREGQ